MRAGAAWQDNSLVFCSSTGGPLNASNIRNRAWKRLLRQAGLPDTLRLHDMRHSPATILMALGEAPRVVQERLRHSQVSVTLQTYSHVLPCSRRSEREPPSGSKSCS